MVDRLGVQFLALFSVKFDCYRPEYREFYEYGDRERGYEPLKKSLIE